MRNIFIPLISCDSPTALHEPTLIYDSGSLTRIPFQWRAAVSEVQGEQCRQERGGPSCGSMTVPIDQVRSAENVPLLNLLLCQCVLGLSDISRESVTV